MFSPRIGRDDCYIPLMVGPVGFGIPRWIVLVLLYLAIVLTLGLYADQIGDRPANVFAASGPALIGLIDLFRRLRTTRYAWVNPAGGEVISQASILDRLTMRECGWYFGIINLPLPLWLIGVMVPLIMRGA
ncbi:MAG: hypothetical protein K2X44_04990 [Magnetospirillum sp.]|nr:hypothetical protein [Magnetospirillum sp.]